MTAVALSLNLTDSIQRYVPGYVALVQDRIEGTDGARAALDDLSGGQATTAGAGDQLTFDQCAEDPAQLLAAGPRESRGHSGMAQLEATGTRGPARAGGAGRLLDVLVHQLPAHPALHHGLGCEVPAEGPHRDRGAQSRIRLRAGGAERGRTTPSGSV